ncbi:conserved hypothetical protein [Luteimonas sp. 9C]|uniref:class I SAM-dependent methyltransferase n=1 Tax=Luteimonas sp. 9C TaxID=2653148 RepID=UPI0012EF41D8|nr:class I SAM-dependent methyltransferase [Luteimonas sp. 9C]VXA94670.1 conserved hypothetical protein [Luteimonas sp. 9C]
MSGFMTVRRLGGGILAIAGVAGIAVGILSSTTSYLVLGALALWLLVFGGIASLLQRAGLLIRMIAATRADLEGLALGQQRLSGELRERMTVVEQAHRRAIGLAQDETVRLRKDMKRSLAGIEGYFATLADDQAGAATIQTANQLSIISMLVDATSNQRRMEDETRRGLMEHSGLAMRVFRDIHSELETRQGSMDDAVKHLGRQSSEIGELKSVIESIDRKLSDAGNSLRHIEATHYGVDTANKSLAELQAAYEADKKKLLALTRDEKMLRSISRRGMQWLKYETVREVEAVLQLRQMLQVESQTPLLGGWAMDPESVYGLVQLLTERRPQRVVELGSGASTVWVAMALRRCGTGKIISYDHLPEYAEQTRQALRRAGLEDWAEVRHAPLAEVAVGTETYIWYSIEDVAGDAPIEVLMVDGPPASTGALARYPAVPRFFEALGDQSLVIVDDATRSDEKQMLERWGNEFPRLRPVDNLGTRTVVLALESKPAAAVLADS